MVSAIVDHALGKMTKRDIYEMLTIPSSYSKMRSAPAKGLYLANIEFYEKAMELKADDEKAIYKLENKGERETDDSHRKEILAK